MTESYGAAFVELLKLGMDALARAEEARAEKEETDDEH